MNFEKELEAAKNAAVLAGKAIMDVYTRGDFSIELKADNSPLTEADKNADEIIARELKKAFPSYALLSEESIDDNTRLENEYCFIVDPLDGTKEFIKRNGQFTVNIALSYKHKSVMGVIYVPVSEELYYAAQGYGAFYKNASSNAVKINVSNRTENLRMVVSSSHGCKEEDELIRKYDIKNIVRMGSSLKGCLIAKGDAELYYRFNPTMEWDVAAMQCIAEQAGAVFMQADNTPMLYNREDSVNRKGFYVVNCKENVISL